MLEVRVNLNVMSNLQQNSFNLFSDFPEKFAVIAS